MTRPEAITALLTLRPVSREWLKDQEARDLRQGVDQPCINWDAMKRIAREKGVAE